MSLFLPFYSWKHVYCHVANHHLPESLGFPDPHVAQLVKPQSNENSFSTNPAVSARYFFPTNECHSQRW